ncbi:MAG TPA: hypothetical protein VME40_16050 [Caulobacteraceae bacterium]|nr:hypothetical protein [Caulobacteraceae bacterium]
MDRSRRRSGFLIAVAAFAASAASLPPAPPLRAMRWLAPGVDAATAMTRRPTECLGAASDPATAYEIELGRAAFRTPLLLGGQAARAGLTCESCHRSGHDNPNFDFPGVSGAPGTADVGASVLSSHRGGHPFAPVPIPNLSGPKAALKTDQDPASGALAARIDVIATQEFDGAEPPPAVLQGLAAYVRALSPAACPADATEPVTAEAGLADVRRAVRAALAALGHGDGASAALMVEAARSQLGDIDERYAGQDLASERAALRGASSDLAAAEFDARHNPPAAKLALELWLARQPTWAPSLLAAEPRSLYAPSRLAAAARPEP